MPIEGKETAKSMDHESGEELAGSARTKPGSEKKPSFNAGKSKSRYNPATHTMRGGSGGYANKESKVRSLSPQEHRQAAAALHSAGQTHAAAHHISAAEVMEQEAPQAGEGDASMVAGMYGKKTGQSMKPAGPTGKPMGGAVSGVNPRPGGQAFQGSQLTQGMK